jgi:hypothetical protein
MIPIPFLLRRRQELGCTIEIEHSPDSLHAHVELDGDVALQPGDRVRVHGAPIRVRFGQRLVLRRDVTVERADWSELYEVSFTPGRLS